jgi:multidrug efflux system membrane fusion protein
MNSNSPKKQSVNKNYSPFIAITLAAAVTLWIASGVLKASDFEQEQAVVNSENVILPKVRIKQSVAEDHVKMINVMGVTQAMRRVDLRAEVLGLVSYAIDKEGSIVDKGEVIIKIEDRDRAARVKFWEAKVRKSQIDFKASTALRAKGFSAETKLADVEQELAEAEAELINAKINANNGVIKAPFKGVLNKINTEVGALVGPNINIGSGTLNDGTAVAVIIESNPIVVSGSVSEYRVANVKIGAPCMVKLVNGIEAEGIVRYVSKIADPVTRTFAIEAEVPNDDYKIPAGVTAAIAIPIGHEKAHFIPSSNIALNEEGQIGIKLLENLNDNVGDVSFKKINTFDHDNGGIWVSNIGTNANIITLGQAFVKNGQKAIGIPEFESKQLGEE